jgi:uridylate kinase
MSDPASPKPYRRILLKPSGEVLGGGNIGIDPEVCLSFIREIIELSSSGIEIALVIGGGNIFRGINAEKYRMNRIAADHIGMLATMINGIALKEFIRAEGAKAEVLSALSIPGVIPLFNADEADCLLSNGVITIFTAGTGHPYFSTDTAAALRAVQIKADILMKSTKVDGVYDKDPVANRDAKLISRISYDDYLQYNLKVMDGSAIALCRDQKLPVLVFNMTGGNLARAIHQMPIGTLIC